MKGTWLRIWQVLYPVVVYYIMYNFIYSLCMILFGGLFPALFYLGLASLITIPFMIGIYKRMPIIKEEGHISIQELVKNAIYIFMIIFAGIFLNYLITQLGLIHTSEGFEKANQVLFDGNFKIKIFANCICIPFLEELVYRGIVCNQLRMWLHPTWAILISAFLFGLMHFNIVQFLYAFLVGCVIGFCYLKTKRLYVAYLGHAITNLFVLFFSVLS